MAQLPHGISKKVRYHLEHILDMFPNHRMTLLIRNPLQPVGIDDTLITIDSFDQIIAAVEAQRDAQVSMALNKFKVPGALN